MSVVTEPNMPMKKESAPMNIATISAGFEKGDFLVREEQGNRVYFDFFEEVSVNDGLWIRRFVDPLSCFKFNDYILTILITFCHAVMSFHIHLYDILCPCAPVSIILHSSIRRSTKYDTVIIFTTEHTRHSTTFPTRDTPACLGKTKNIGLI